VDDLKGKNDGNNVSLDREMRLLAENALRFGVASNLIHSKIREIRSAIKDGSAG
jgi:flagellar basal-body rod protein FlgB